MPANNSSLRPFAALLAAAAVLTCGGGDGAGPGDAGALTGSWSVSIPAATGGGVSCTLPPVILDLEHGGGTLRGDFRATGTVNCLYQGAPFTGTLGNGKVVNGSVSGSAVAFDLRTEALHFAGTLLGDTAMSGGMSWEVTFVGTPVGQVTLGGTWTARRVAAGVPDSILVLPATVMLPQLDSVALTASVRDGFGAVIPGVPVSWQSEDTVLATVTASGLVRSKGPGGLVTIRATAGNAVGRRTVSIQRVASAIELSPDSLVLHRGRLAVLQARVLDRVGDSMAAPITARSLDTTRLTAFGGSVINVQARSLLGNARVVATSGPFQDTTVITLVSVPAQVVISSGPLVLQTGAVGNLTATVFDSAGLTISPSVTWTSLDPVIAGISPIGQVTAGSSEGLARIVAQAANSADTAKVLVRNTLPQYSVTSQDVGGQPFGLALSVQGTLYVADQLNGRILRGQAPAFDLTPVLQTGGLLRSVAFTASGDTAFATRDSANQVLIIRVAGDSVLGGFQAPGEPTALAVTADGTRLMIGTASEVRTRSLPDLVEVGSFFTYPALVQFLAIHPTLQVGYATADGVHEINATNGTRTRLFTGGNGAGGAVVSPDLATLYMVLGNRGLLAIEATSGQVIDSIPVTGFGLAITPDGRDLVVGSDSGLTFVDRASLVTVAFLPLGSVYQILTDSVTASMIVTDRSGKVHVLR